MKLLSCNSAPLLGLCIVALLSCSGNKEKESTSSITDTVVTADPAPVSSVVTTAQHMVIAKHKVSDFQRWKISYEAHDSMRLAHGLHNYVIGRSVEDSNMIMVVLKADDLEKAKAFGSSADLKTAMKKAGVIGTPEVKMGTMVYQDTSVIGNVPRALTSFKVKDWDTWKTSFESGNQERIDNGVVTRTYGFAADDSTRVMLVTAIMDTAKAGAYWNSDALKKRREAGGVISAPERFVFTIAARY